MAENKPVLTILMRFLGTPERPVTSQEFQAFWKECSDEEKKEFKLFASKMS